ncbi:hypothetical protein [Terrabacter sp. 2RAF25]|uniref:hypothetical protein n=1 Tax=Terrabacter sp. 2RAF25 TaxID=3232998 RepID=UPI003F9AA39E
MTTTPTPDADVRAALDDASRVAGLTFNPESVLVDGHRAVRRRRATATALGVAVTAVVAAVAVQVGAGRTDPVPAAPPTASLTTPPAPPAPTGPLTGTTASDGIRQGKSFDLTATAQADGRVRETWTFYQGSTKVDAVTRTTAATAVGQVSLITPDQSGQAGVVYGYLVTGTVEGTVMVEVATAPGAHPGQGTFGSLHDAATGRVAGTLFLQELTGDPTAKDVIGVTWNRTTVSGTSVRWLADGAALRTERGTGDPQVAIVTVSPRTSVLLWRDGDRFSSGVRSGPLAVTDPGTLQVTTQPQRKGAAGREHDLAVGWVASTSVTLTSTDPADAFTVTYGASVDGRTPFVARSTNPDVKGKVTVTGGGETQTLTAWDPS